MPAGRVLYNLSGIALIVACSAFIASVIQEARRPLPAEELTQTTFQLAPHQVQERMLAENIIILDVRNMHELERDGLIEGAISMPLPELDERIFSLIPDKNTEIIVMCHTRNTRSLQAVEWLQENGYTNVHNLDGGLKAWQTEGLPLVPFVVLDDEV